MKKLFELEHLVNNGGDPKLIEMLRKELNLGGEIPAKDPIVRVSFLDEFDPKLYLKMKDDGLTDVAIAKQMYVSTRTLNVAKKAHGIILKPRKEKKDPAENRYGMIMRKMERQERIQTALAMEVIARLQEENKKLQDKLKEVTETKNKEIQILRDRNEKLHAQKEKYRSQKDQAVSMLTAKEEVVMQ